MKRPRFENLKRSSVLLLGALLLLGLQPLPEALAQPPGQKQTAFKTRRVDDQTFLYESADGTPFAAARITPNFVIYYNQTGPNYRPFMNLVANTLEEAWTYFHAQGYRNPTFADTHRLAVYIRPRFSAVGEEWAAGFYRLFPRSGDPYLDLLYHDLSVGTNGDFVRGLCTHEFFHFLQHSYDANFSPDMRWMWEATATWSEDELTPGAPFVGSYLRHMPSWYLLWGMGLSLKSFNQQDANIRNMPYGGAAYFKYLSEHDPSGSGIVRRIWDGVRAAGPGNSMGVIKSTLGEDRYRDLFINFAVAVPLKTHAPWDFHRGGEINPEIIPRTRWKGWYFQEWDTSQRRITPGEFTLEPFSASYFELIAPGALQTSTRLRLVVKPKGSGAALLAKVIRFSGANLNSVEGVDEIPLPGSGQPGQLLVENYGSFSNRTNRVLAVVANSGGSPAQVEFAAAVSEPPFLREIRIERPEKGTVYEARWEGEGRERNLNIVKNELKLELGEEHVETLDVELTFSREIDGSPVIQVGGQEIRLTEKGESKGRGWTGQIGRLTFRGPPRTRKLPLLIQAVSPDGLTLDANPATAPLFDPETLQWQDYEPGDGIDRTHILQVKKFDLNGLWRSGSTQVRILHERQSVRGMTMQGKVLFQGTLTGLQINGQMKVRYPPEWQARCPGQAEGWATLQMVASEDAEQITGRFQLMKIDEKCNQVPEGWKDLTLERVPENRPGGRA